MIMLHIKLLSFYYLDNNFKKKFSSFDILDEYDENLTFNDVLFLLYNKYKIDNNYFSNFFIPHLTELLWGQFFPKKVCYQIDDNDNDYLKLKLCDLERQFNISKLDIPVYLNYDGIGKAIGMVDGIKFFFHFNEKDLHHKPHIHCSYSGIETRIEIDTLEILDTPFKKSKMDKAVDFVREHQKELLNYWNKAIINGEAIKLNIII